MSSGDGIVGGLYQRWLCRKLLHRRRKVMNGGNICPVINGVTNASVGQLSPKLLYEFRTLIFHPEPIRAGQVYSSSVCNGANARTSQVWVGTTHVVLTMRAIDPANPSTMSAPQMVIYDGTLQNVPAYADYEPLWGLNLNCTSGPCMRGQSRGSLGAIRPTGTALAHPRNRGRFGRCGVLPDGQ